jgi:hypothetical protein
LVLDALRGDGDRAELAAVEREDAALAEDVERQAPEARRGRGPTAWVP